MRAIIGSLLVLFLASLLSACGASENTVATAIALTQNAAPTSTPVPSTATLPPAPSDTPEPAPTATSTPDTRVVDTDPKNLLLEREDLPTEAKYYLPHSSWITPHRNSEIISTWGAEWGREYLDSTGRIDGWLIYLARGTSTVIAPEQVFDNVMLFKTPEGARLFLDEYATCKDPEGEYQIVNTDFIVGDGTNVCTWKEMQSSGKNRVEYRIEFTRRNVAHAVTGWGWEADVKPEYVQQIALALLEEIDQAPLASEVSFRP